MPGFAALASHWWKPVLFIILAGHITNVCVTLFLHRSQTHRGVTFSKIAEVPMRIWLWLSTSIVTKEWVACHRKHHAFADREGDPHSPLLEGLRNIIIKGAFYYRTAIKQPGMLEKYGKGTTNDWLERHVLARLPWLGIVLMLGIDIYLFGFFIGPLVWGAQMMWIPFWAAGIISGVGAPQQPPRRSAFRQVQGEVVRVRCGLGVHSPARAVRPGESDVRAGVALPRPRCGARFSRGSRNGQEKIAIFPQTLSRP